MELDNFYLRIEWIPGKKSIDYQNQLVCHEVLRANNN